MILVIKYDGTTTAVKLGGRESWKFPVRVFSLESLVKNWWIFIICRYLSQTLSKKLRFRLPYDAYADGLFDWFIQQRHYYWKKQRLEGEVWRLGGLQWGRLAQKYQIYCAFCHKSTKFVTQVDQYIINRVGCGHKKYIDWIDTQIGPLADMAAIFHNGRHERLL